MIKEYRILIFSSHPIGASNISGVTLIDMFPGKTFLDKKTAKETAEDTLKKGTQFIIERVYVV